MRWWLCLCLLGCGPESEFDPETPWEEGALGEWRPGLTVAQAGGCSTGIVAGLSRQLIAEVNCLRPDTLTDFSGAGIDVGGNVFPFLQPGGTRGLRAAVAARGRNIHVNSALRTLAQQYLLYRWYQEGACGIGLAARPGRSNHESGLALDIEDDAGWRASLEAQSFRWFGADDPVHFDYRGGGTVALAGLSILAFQRLWNRNHPEDVIDEDGIYGPQTEARLRASPTDGFPVGACVAPPPPVDAAPPPPPPPPPVDAAPPPPPVDAAPVVDADTPPPVDAAEPRDFGAPPETPDAAVRPPREDPPADAAVELDPPAEDPDWAVDLDGGLGARAGAHLQGRADCRAAPGLGGGGWALAGLALLAVRRRRRRFKKWSEIR